jgi:Fur family iron response transcriptional regulator
MKHDPSELLRHAGVRPSAHRLAVAKFVLYTRAHPSAEHVWVSVRKDFPMISRATVYNTLNLFVDKGILQRIPIGEGKVVYDPDLSPHHHLVDEDTGVVHDIPWEALEIPAIEHVSGFDVTDCQVVMRGRKK